MKTIFIVSCILATGIILPAAAQVKPLVPCATISATVTTTLVTINISNCGRRFAVRATGAEVLVSTKKMKNYHVLNGTVRSDNDFVLDVSETGITLSTVSGTASVTIEQCAAAPGSRAFCKW